MDEASTPASPVGQRAALGDRREQPAFWAMASLLGGYLMVGVVAAAMVAGRPDPTMVLTMAPVALVAALIAAPVALGVLLAYRSRRFTRTALTTLGASVAVATAALGAMVVVSFP